MNNKTTIAALSIALCGFSGASFAGDTLNSAIGGGLGGAAGAAVGNAIGGSTGAIVGGGLGGAGGAVVSNSVNDHNRDDYDVRNDRRRGRDHHDHGQHKGRHHDH